MTTLRSGSALAERLAQVQAAGTLHADVGEHDVGIEFVDHAERPLSADGLPDHLTRSENAASIALRPSMTISWSSTRTIRTGPEASGLSDAMATP